MFDKQREFLRGVAEVADALNLSHAVTRQLLETGQLPAMRIPRPGPGAGSEWHARRNQLLERYDRLAEQNLEPVA